MATTTSITATWSAGSGGVPDTYDFRWRLQGTTPWTTVTGLVVTTYTVSGLPQGTTIEWQVRAVNGVGTSDWSAIATCTSQYQYSFFACGNGWTLSAPTVKVYGLDHLIGMFVVGLLDGVPLTSQIVADDGSVTFPFAASNWKVGIPFTAQVQTPYLDGGNPTMQGRRKNITAITVRVSAGGQPEAGTNQPDGSVQMPQAIAPPWSNMTPVPVTTTPTPSTPPTYTSVGGQTVTKLVTGDLRIPVTAEWAKPGQVAVQQTGPQPLTVIATIAEFLEGDSVEQVFSPQQQNNSRPRPPGTWMLKPGG
jgi:hypothetical protein